MANKEIKHTIRLEGEKEYSAAIKEAQRNLKTLRSELKAETAELGANATAQQKNEARAKSLKAQIAEQEKVVETLRKALAEAKKDYGDNEDVVQKWEQKLNEARTTLANMQNGLAETENGIRGVSDATAEGVTATKSFADALGSIATVGESVSSAIEDIFTGLISTVSDTIVELWDLIGETAAKADRYSDIAGYWNTNAATIEKYARSVESTGKNFEDLEAIVNHIVLGGKGKDIAEMLGVSDVNYEDQWEYAMAVMDRMYELRQSGNVPDNMWETIFGAKKATKAMDVLNAWGQIKEGLSTYNADEGGFGMGENALEYMADLYVQMNTVEQKWIALKNEFAAGLGETTADLLVNVNGGLDAINDYLNADSDAERDAALEKLKANIHEFFVKIANAIKEGLAVLEDVGTELAGDEDPIVSFIGKALKAIADAGQWLIDNADKVKAALETIFGIWLVAKLALIGGKIAKIIADIETIKAFKNWGGVVKGAGSGLSGVGNAAGAGSGAAAGAGGIGAWASTLGMSFQMAGGASVALPIAALAGAGYAGAKMIQANLEDEALNAVYGGEQGRGGVVDTMSEESLRRAWAYYRIYQNEDMAGTEEAFDARDRLMESLERDGFDLSEQSVSLLENIFDNYLNESDPDGLVEALLQRRSDFFAGGMGIQDAGNVIADRISEILGGTNQNGQNGLNGDDLSVFRGLPGLLRQALFTQISGMKVVMDGETVGRIVTPYVSGGIALKVVELQ